MSDLYQCEPANSQTRYNVMAESETEAIQKLRSALNLQDDVAVSIKHVKYMGWIIF